MARHVTPADGRSPANPPSVVQVSVVVSRRGPTLREAMMAGTVLTRGLAALLAVLIATAAAILTLVALQGLGAGSAGPVEPLRDGGQAGVSAAYRNTATCLSVARVSRSSARLDRVHRCWPYGF
jgi:hypothetical protein